MNIPVLFRRLSLLFRRTQFQQELDDEMSFHRIQLEKELIEGGMSPTEARYAAVRRFGNSARLKGEAEQAVSMRFESVLQDVRFAVRQLAHKPGFAVVAVLILGLGIGVSIAIFSFVDAALLRPLPFDRPERLIAVDEGTESFAVSNLSLEDYKDWVRMNSSVSAIDVYTGTGYLLHMGAITEPVPGARVSAGFFKTLGVKPILGRDFRPGEDQAGHAKIVILPYGTWQQRFGARRDVIGTSVQLSGDEYTIVGVLPRNFSWARQGAAEFWAPLLDPNGCEQRRGCHNLDGIARLRDGVTVQAARADFQNIAVQLQKLYPDSNRGQGSTVQPLTELLIGDVRPILLTLLAGAGLLLLIACVNVASLLLIRSETRRKEIAVRGALGATLRRLVRQFVTEGLLLSTAGSVFGLVVAISSMSLLKRLIPKSVEPSLPFLSGVGFNAHTAAAMAAVTLLAAILMAATPMLRLANLKMPAELAESGRGTAQRFWSRLGANLVVVEISIAVVLLAGAGLLGKSFYRLVHVELGMRADHLAVMSVVAPDKQYATDPQRIQLYNELSRRLTSLPGVQSAGMVSNLPLNCNCNTEWIRIVGQPFHGEHNEVLERDSGTSYLQTLGARLVKGRLFNAQDRMGQPFVTIINESLARRYFPGQDPIGKTILDFDANPKNARQVVGVIADMREGALDAEMWPAEYRVLDQGPANFFSVVVRTATDEKALLPTLVSTIRSIDPNLGVYGENTMQQQLQSTQSALLHRFSAWLVGGFAAVALVLGVVGLYGIVAYTVGQRTREIGVRMALGAQRAAVYGMVMRQAGILTGIGLALGLVCAVLASTLMKSVLFGVAAWDALTLVSVAVVLGLASLIASFLPAHRAASVNPVQALRTE